MNEGKTSKIAFISYYKGEFTIHSLERKEPLHTAASHSLLTAGSLAAGDGLTPFACRSIEDDKLRHGIFFHFVLEGLKGKAKNEDNKVTWARLADYVTTQVNRKSPRLAGGGGRQTPHEIPW